MDRAQERKRGEQSVWFGERLSVMLRRHAINNRPVAPVASGSSETEWVSREWERRVRGGEGSRLRVDRRAGSAKFYFILFFFFYYQGKFPPDVIVVSGCINNATQTDLCGPPVGLLERERDASVMSCLYETLKWLP